MYDVIIVGGGPAGLQAALTLGRMHKQVLLLDSGAYRNGSVEHMHNFITNDGTPPEKFRSQARAELAAYTAIEVRDVAAGRVDKQDDGFLVTAGDEEVRSRLVILATGVRDELPPIPGLAGVWGTHAFTCPFCHGHELAGCPIGVLAGPPALHLVSLLGPIGSSVTVFPEEVDLDAEQRAIIERQGAILRPGAIADVSVEADGLRVQVGEESVTVAGLFVATGRFVQSAPFAAQLGVDLLDSGCVEVDDFGRTSVPGVFAAGDLAHRRSQPMPMASVLAAAAAGQLAATACVADLLVH